MFTSYKYWVIKFIYIKITHNFRLLLKKNRLLEALTYLLLIILIAQSIIELATLVLLTIFYPLREKLPNLYRV